MSSHHMYVSCSSMLIIVLSHSVCLSLCTGDTLYYHVALSPIEEKYSKYHFTVLGTQDGRYGKWGGGGGGERNIRMTGRGHTFSFLHVCSWL